MGYILITGGNLKNKGAQSMMFIAVDEMKKRFPDSKIIVVSDEDATASGEQIGQFAFQFRDSVCLYGKKYRFVQHRYGKLDRMGDAAEISRHVDMIIDISGYTFGSNWGWMANLLAAYRAKRAKQYKAPIYFMPQSFGPFEWKGIMGRLTGFYMAKWLSYAKVLYAREQEGYDLLTEGYGFRNVRLSEDLVLQNKGICISNIYKNPPVMSLPPIKKGSIAVLPNIRNAKYGDMEKLIVAYQEIINFAIHAGRTVYLIRHATEDLSFCKRIKVLFKKEPEVILLKNDFSCFEYESLVKNFDYVVASRYHAIVHAYKQGIPCIVLGWAVKYQELLSKFCQQEYTLDVRCDINVDELMDKVKRMEERFSLESEMISKAVTEVQKKNAFDLVGKAEKNIADTVKENLCTSCGICAAVCPRSCISFEKKRGAYLPKINLDICIHCGKCLKICPGYSYIYKSESKTAAEIQTPECKTGFDHCAKLCLSVQAKDKEVLKNATSGGFVTALIRKLLNDGRYETAFLASGYAYDNQMMVMAVHKGDELLSTQRSRYLPVSQKNAVSYILAHPQENIIYVATPCAVHGLCNALRDANQGREHVLMIGLFCDKSMNYSIYEYVKQLRPWKYRLTEFHFRDKRAGGWPGNMRLEFENGSYRHISAKERMIVKDFFQMSRCLYCLDKLNMEADFSVGDNYTGKHSFKGGSNSLIIRTPLGHKVWKACQEEFVFAGIDFSDIAASQHIEEKREHIRNNRIYARSHGGRSVEQGLPSDLEEVLKSAQSRRGTSNTKSADEWSWQLNLRDFLRLKKHISDIRIGEEGKFALIRWKKEGKRLKLYWNAAWNMLRTKFDLPNTISKIGEGNENP